MRPTWRTFSLFIAAVALYLCCEAEQFLVVLLQPLEVGLYRACDLS